MKKQNLTTRRSFIRTFLASAAALPVLGATFGALGSVSTAFAAKKEAKSKDAPLPDGMTAVPESDPVATAIGYKANPKDIDFKKYPNRAKPENKSQNCGNCAIYTSLNDSWGKCQMLPNGVVAKKGWCGSWNKKA